MGIAAYNRGGDCISRQAKAEQRPIEFEMMDRLNSASKSENARTPFGPVNITEGNGGFWVYDPQSKSGFGYWHRTIAEAVKSWNITIVGFDGEWQAIPII